MSKYIFLLGQASDLAKQELAALISRQGGQVEYWGTNFALVETDSAPQDLMSILGGTVKIARFVKTISSLDELDLPLWQSMLASDLNIASKNHFGFSIYNLSKKQHHRLSTLALSLKRQLKDAGYKMRLVTSRDMTLSSVIVATNNLLGKELLIIKDQAKIFLAMTVVVQDYKYFGHRDMSRPERDTKSGMLPPKLARMMLNIRSADEVKILLDPFCGSGTILQEAALLGFQKILGSDSSQKAVDDSIANLNWLGQEFNIDPNLSIKKTNVENISQMYERNSIDLIVTEPFMGNSRQIMRARNIAALATIKTDLQRLYQEAFTQFHKVLSAQSQVIFVFPIFAIGGQHLYTLNRTIIEKIGWQPIRPSIKTDKFSPEGNIIYSRPEQRVVREITMWQKK